MKLKNRKDYRRRRHLRIRRRVSGTAERPRMSIYVSNKHMYVQFVDDDAATTLASASTVKGDGKNNLETAKMLGECAARTALEQGIARVVVDRGGFRFHGRLKQVVDAAVASGLSISSAVESGAEKESK